MSARLGICVSCTLLGACFPPPASHGEATYVAQQQPAPAYHDRAFDFPAEDLDAFVTQNTAAAGYAKEGSPIMERLDTFAPVPVPLQRGRCYRMVVRLDPDASFSAHARRGVAFVYHNGDRGMEVHGGPGIHGPLGGIAGAGCPQQNANATFDIVANWGSATDKSHVHDLGTGGVTLQLYSKTIDERGLSVLEADEAQQIADAERFKREEERKRRGRILRGCQVCEQKHVECVADFRRNATRATCEREYDTCAFTEAGLPSARECR